MTGYKSKAKKAYKKARKTARYYYTIVRRKVTKTKRGRPVGTKNVPRKTKRGRPKGKKSNVPASTAWYRRTHPGTKKRY